MLGDFDPPLHHVPASGPSPPTAPGSRSRWSTARTSQLPGPAASSTATAPTRSASTRPSRTTGSRCSTAASSSPSPTCAAAARWAGPGTRTGGWSTRPTPSPTSSPAAATWSTRGIARPGALVGRGGSAGGLLIGAVANQAPELFRALVAEVPFVDCVTTMLDDELPLTVGEWEEWGNPLADDVGLPAHARLLALRQRDAGRIRTARRAPIRTSSSPAGLNDPRVAYWEPAKWVAKLRAESPSTRVLLKTELGAGHGGPSGPLRRLEGGGPGLRLPPRRLRPGREGLSRPVDGYVVGGDGRRRRGAVDPGAPGVWKVSVNGAWLPGGSVTGAPLTVAAKRRVRRRSP